MTGPTKLLPSAKPVLVDTIYSSDQLVPTLTREKKTLPSNVKICSCNSYWTPDQFEFSLVLCFTPGSSALGTWYFIIYTSFISYCEVKIFVLPTSLILWNWFYEIMNWKNSSCSEVTALKCSSSNQSCLTFVQIRRGRTLKCHFVNASKKMQDRYASNRAMFYRCFYLKMNWSNFKIFLYIFASEWFLHHLKPRDMDPDPYFGS